MAEQFQNFFVTKLREACDATATTIYVDTIPAITEGTLVLEYANSTKHEIIHFTGVSGYGLTGCTRGLEGTTAQSHSAGTDVRQNLTAGMIDKIINGVITTENIANSAVTTAKINNGAVTADKIDFTTLGNIIYKSSAESSSKTPTLAITSGDFEGVLIAQAVGRVDGTGDTTLQISATNVTDAQGGYGAVQSHGYSQVTSSLYMAKIPANTTTTITATFSKNGDWRRISAIIIPITGIKG